MRTRNPTEEAERLLSQCLTYADRDTLSMDLHGDALDMAETFGPDSAAARHALAVERAFDTLDAASRHPES